MGQSRTPVRAPKNQDRRDWGLLLLILALFLFVAALFVEGGRGEKNQSSVTTRDRELLNNINTYLKDTAIREEVQKRNAIEEYSQPESAEEMSIDSRDEKVNPLLFDQEDPGQQVLRDLEVKRRRQGRPTTPDQRISSKLERDAWVREYEKRQKDEYVRQFLENAKKQGVDVRLNKDLDVTGLRIRPEEEAIRVPQSVPQGSK
jgi:hypothetical protein